MNRKQLNEICTFARNTRLMQEPFVKVTLIHASFAAAFDAENMKWLMSQGLLPEATDAEIEEAFEEADRLMMETYYFKTTFMVEKIQQSLKH